MRKNTGRPEGFLFPLSENHYANGIGVRGEITRDGNRGVLNIWTAADDHERRMNVDTERAIAPERRQYIDKVAGQAGWHLTFGGVAHLQFDALDPTDSAFFTLLGASRAPIHTKYYPPRINQRDRQITVERLDHARLARAEREWLMSETALSACRHHLITETTRHGEPVYYETFRLKPANDNSETLESVASELDQCFTMPYTTPVSELPYSRAGALPL